MKLINSGQMGFSDQGEVFQTVLGSCISLCIYDRVKKMGGMIHYLLPFRVESEKSRSMSPLCFGDEAIPLLLREFKERGSRPRDLVSYIVGGAKFGERAILQNQSIDIGTENVRVARDLLRKFQIPVKSEKVDGDKTGMTIRFDSQTGEVFMAKRHGVRPLAEMLAAAQQNVVGESFSSYSVPASMPMTLRSVPSSSVSSRAAAATDEIKVLIVDDSAPIRKIIRSNLEAMKGVVIVGEAENPIQGEELRRKHSPHIMTLDIQMPQKDGITYLREMQDAKATTCVILISDMGPVEVAAVMDGLHVGTFEYLQKPSGQTMPAFQQKLKETIFAAKKFADRKVAGAYLKPASLATKSPSAVRASKGAADLIVIGSSTGGIGALKEIFNDLPGETPPILVVQHMPPVFSAAFSAGLNHTSRIRVKEAEHGDVLENNTAYIAPGGKQMSLGRMGERYVVKVTDDAPVNLFKPSVDFLFHSVAKLEIAKKTHAAILTGMGDDGARGLLALKERGSFTVTQNEETCVVYGMPKAAFEMGASQLVLALNEIALHLLRG